MNPRSLVIVAVKVWALVTVAGVIAASPAVALFASLPAPALGGGQVVSVIRLAVRFVVAILLFAASAQVARYVAPDAPAPTAIGPARVLRLAVSLAALFLAVEAIESLAAPLYSLANPVLAAASAAAYDQFRASNQNLVVRSITTIAAAAAVLVYQKREARSEKGEGRREKGKSL